MYLESNACAMFSSLTFYSADDGRPPDTQILSSFIIILSEYTDRGIRRRFASLRQGKICLQPTRGN